VPKSRRRDFGAGAVLARKLTCTYMPVLQNTCAAQYLRCPWLLIFDAHHFPGQLD
jgi:hypothetical protein